VGKEGQPSGRNRRGTHPVGRRRQPRIAVFLPKASEDRQKGGLNTCTHLLKDLNLKIHIGKS